MQNGKGLKECEGDDFDPEQRHHRDGMVVSTVGQMPVLGQLAKGIVLDVPARVPDVPDGRTVVAVQIASDHPYPVLLLRVMLPLLSDTFTLGPLFMRFDTRTGVV